MGSVCRAWNLKYRNIDMIREFSDEDPKEKRQAVFWMSHAQSLISYIEQLKIPSLRHSFVW